MNFSAGIYALKPLVFSCMLVISIMGVVITSVQTSNKIKQILIGMEAALFIMSDSLIAVNKLCVQFLFQLLQRGTYGLAQRLITKGYLTTFRGDQTIEQSE